MRIYIGRHVFTKETLDTIIKEAIASPWKFHIAVHKEVDAMPGLNEAESKALVKLVLSVAGKRGGRNSHHNKVVVAAKVMVTCMWLKTCSETGALCGDHECICNK